MSKVKEKNLVKLFWQDRTKIFAILMFALASFGGAKTANAQDMLFSARNWNGAYLGADVDYGTGTSRKDVTSTGASSGDFTVNGVAGGGTVGYNWQKHSFVFGVEGDIYGGDISGSHACAVRIYTCETENHWLATFRPRVGYAFGHLMPYITGGGAVGDVRVHSFLNTNGSVETDDTKTQLGWTAGGGVELGVSANWSVKAEYLYVDLSDTDALTTGRAPTKTSFDENIVKIGANYKF